MPTSLPDIEAPAVGTALIAPQIARHSIWAAFDRIYCISLKSRPDRQAGAIAQFKRVGLQDLVEFILVDKHPTDSERGIFESHMRCLRTGLTSDAQKILVFEDDVVFQRFSEKRLANALTFIESDHPWDIFFLGCFVNSSRKTPFPSVLEIDYRCTAHAYVINRPFAQQLVKMKWQAIAFDDLLRQYCKGSSYALYPACAFQGSASTDNDKLRRVDRLRRLVGGFRRVQRWNEFSSRRLVPLIIAHAAVVIALITLVLVRRHR